MNIHENAPQDEEAAFARMRREDRQRAVERLDRLSWLLDAQWRVPLTRIRFGMDPVISLVPVAGDLAAAAVASTIVWHAARFGAPRALIFQMIVNLVIDATIGSVPILGSVFDVFFKASRRNMRLLRRFLDEHEA